MAERVATALENGWKAKSKSQKRLTEIKKSRYLYLLIFPGLAALLVFKIAPMWGLLIAFQDYYPFLGMGGSDWVGFQHFIEFFNNNDFFMLLQNTLCISFLNLIFFFPAPVLLALLLNELSGQKYKKFVQSVVYMPHFLSWVVVVGLTVLLFSQSTGLINMILVSLGFDKIDVLTNEKLFYPVLVLQNIWKETGWGTIVFLAALSGVDVSQYEAADIDGASRLQKIWYINLPFLKGIIITMFILRVGQVMDVGFEQVLLMANGAVSQIADVFETYVYRHGVQNGEFSYSTAVGMFKSIVGLTMVLVTNYISRKAGEEGLF